MRTDDVAVGGYPVPGGSAVVVDLSTHEEKTDDRLPGSRRRFVRAPASARAGCTDRIRIDCRTGFR
ncbi:hypothetical protein MIAR_06200 [Microbacterium arabinogalactanolyticum]|uniref:Uncharacterized protein n=1 Tax=Microbacterium arabinogalactanolyticum TaxID=69365 RepID=A0ABQ5NEH5_9MICO|nr:hypothetical protein MIAR_06200 [Microbacterium arabinogalactanolyticum]